MSLDDHTMLKVFNASFELAREFGFEGVNKFDINEKVYLEDKPIVDETCLNGLKRLIIKKTWEVLAEYQKSDFSKNPYLQMGKGLISFAKEEPNLFLCIVDPDFNELNNEYYEKNINENLSNISNSTILNDFSDEFRQKIVAQGLLYCFRISEIVAKKSLKQKITVKSENELTENFLMDNLKYWIGAKKFISS